MIEVLGPLQVRGGTASGDQVDMGSPRHREVLAALVVDVGRVVSTETLLERVWGDVGRGASTSNLHAVISRLRGRLALSGLDASVTTVSPGYRLDTTDAAATVDAVRFHQLLTHARAAHGGEDLDRARADLDEALALWRGPAYADIATPFAEVEAARLEGQRVTAWELSVDVDLALGRVGAALDMLPGLVAEHPLREVFRRQHMLALYRSGRQAEALEVYADLRTVLADELGIDPGPQVQELHQRILQQDAELAGDHERPAPKSPAARGPVWHSEVVVPADDLVGRERDVHRLHDLLTVSGQRLVTVTGVGGVGKTRVGYAVAEASRPDFDDGVALVSLAPLTDPALVLPAVGRAFGLTSVEGLDPLEMVAAHLRGRHVLVVIDNLEHLMEAAPGIARLVALCPRLSVLVTSRTTLRVRAELHYQLAPLELPGESARLDEVAGASAVELFVERATRASATFVLDEDNASAVAAICRRLAGIPLALELAAARAHLMPAEAIAEHLDRVMAGSGARDLPPRQRTMRAAIDWGYRLLDAEQQALLRRLATFAGGFTLDAVEAVAEPGSDALALLEDLVAHSLVVRDSEHPELVRFRLLEPVAQFAADQLGGGEEEQARQAHLEHFLRLAEDAAPGYQGAGAIAALEVTHREHANLVAAVEWALTSGQGDLAGRMTWAMWLFWWLRGHLLEGRRLTSAVLGQEVSEPVRVRTHAALGAMAFAQGDLATARHWVSGAELAREVGDPEGEAHNVGGEGLVALAEGRLDDAETHFAETVRLTEHAGLAGEWLWTLVHVWQATIQLLRGSPDDAVAPLDAALAAARRRADPLATYIALFTSVQVALVAGELVTARAQLEEGIALSLDTGDLANLAYFLEALAVVESRAGSHERVAALHGCAAGLRATVGASVYGYYQPDEQLLADALEAASAALGPTYDDVVCAGRSLPPAEAVTFARDPAMVLGAVAG